MARASDSVSEATSPGETCRPLYFESVRWVMPYLVGPPLSFGSLVYCDPSTRRMWSMMSLIAPTSACLCRGSRGDALDDADPPLDLIPVVGDRGGDALDQELPAASRAQVEPGAELATLRDGALPLVANAGAVVQPYAVDPPVPIDLVHRTL